MSSDEDRVDEGIRNKTQSEGLRLRPYKATRDDIHTAYIAEYTQGFVSGETRSMASRQPHTQTLTIYRERPSPASWCMSSLTELRRRKLRPQ